MAVCDIHLGFIFSKFPHWGHTIYFCSRSALFGFECSQPSPSLVFSPIDYHNLDPDLLPFSLDPLN